VIVIGYGTQSREMITASISKLDNKVLENVPYTNAASALQGSISGVRVQSTSGQPGAAPRVIIRGGTSINDPNGATPLYIIDGIIQTHMNDLPSDDIESMQVLKDAAATSIYGARGSNGVVIITTKKGKSGVTKVNYRYDLSVSNIGKMYKMANARDFLTLMRKGLISPPGRADVSARLSLPDGPGTGNDLTNNTYSSTQYLTPENQYKLSEGWQSMPDPIDPSKTLIFSDTDFQALTYQTGISHNNHLEISGGSERATFNAGLGYMTAEGTLINTYYKRLSFDLKGSLKATDWLSISGSVKYSDSHTNSTSWATDISFYRYPGIPPTYKLYFEDGSIAPGFNSALGNPLYFLYLHDKGNSNESLTASLDAELKILPSLTFSPFVSLWSINNTSRSFTPAYWNGPTTYNTSRDASASLDEWIQYQAEGVFNYVYTFGSNHNVSVMAGTSYFNRRESRMSANGRGASSDKIPTLNASAEATTVSSTITDLVMSSYFGRINYNFKYKYLLSLSARYDGASNLGDSHKWGFFPGVSVGWHLDKEDFWNFLPEELLRVKLRGSYGVNGNISRLGDFAAQGSYSVGSIYMGNAAVLMSAMANQDLRWEQSKTFDLGTDLELFNGRINILFDWFNRTTENLITNLTLPLSTGYTSILTNLGSLRNKGVELEISADILPKTNPFKWNVSFNAAKVDSRIKSLPTNGIEKNRVGGYNVWDAKLGNYTWKGGLQEGGRIGDMYTWKQLGVYATDEEAKNAPLDMTITTADKTINGGDAKFLDADGNGIIDDRDCAYMGNPYPTWTGGFSNVLNYKGFDLYVRMDYALGHTIYNYAKLMLDYNLQGDINMTQDAVDHCWKNQGDITDYPRFYYEGRVHNVFRGGRGTSLYHEKGDFLCVREISLGYTIPSVWKINSIRLSVTGNNLYYFTKYSGLNPEEGDRDNGRYAMPRNINFSAKISF